MCTTERENTQNETEDSMMNEKVARQIEEMNSCRKPMTEAGRWKDDRIKKMDKAKLAQRPGVLQPAGRIKIFYKEE